MRKLPLVIIALFFVSLATEAGAVEARIKKVLPQYIDLRGRASLSPSLYERDAYQFFLRNNPEERSGMRFKVQWKGASKSGQLRLRLELRGVQEENVRTELIELPVKNSGALSDWTSLDLRDDAYRNFGELAAWRATLWDGNQMIAEQKSFLW